jgi:SPX domain protein involved in polyphosphate accumulation
MRCHSQVLNQKQTNLPLKPTFVQEYLEKRPFYKYNWDSLIVKLSKLYNLVRTRGHPVQGDSSAGGSQSAFVRQTTKYWVIKRQFFSEINGC